MDRTYEKQIRAKVELTGSPLAGFTFLDGEFTRGEMIILLFRFIDKDPQQRQVVKTHYVAVNNFTGTGANRTLSYMDPGDGTTKTTTIQVSQTAVAGSKLVVPYRRDNDARIIGIISLSPYVTTESPRPTSAQHPVHDEYKVYTMEYTVYFPPSQQMQDLHIKVDANTFEDWTVDSKPAGWTVKKHIVDGQGYISIYKGTSTTQPASGSKIKLKCDAEKRSPGPQFRWGAIIQTTSGTKSPGNGASSTDRGWTLLCSACGDDGCGGTCGDCTPGYGCDETFGLCKPCTPECSVRECGDDGCGGVCGHCGDGFRCDEVTGICEPCESSCDERECGDDGCGASCGECAAGFACDEFLGQCAVCVPSCDGRVCGDDGCGGSCGECPSGSVCFSAEGFCCAPACPSFPDPPAPGRPVAAVVASADELGSVRLSWDASTDPNVDWYEIIDELGGELLATVAQPMAIIEGVEEDRLYTLRVVAHSGLGLYSEPSELVSIYRALNGTAALSLGGPQELSFLPPLTSWHEPYGWTVTVSGAQEAGQLVVAVIGAQPDPAVQDPPSAIHEPFFHLSSEASVTPGPVGVCLPYNMPDVVGSEQDLRLLFLDRGVWQDVTSGVDSGRNLICGTLPALGTIAIMNGQSDIPTVSAWGILVVALLLLIGAKLIFRGRAMHPVG